MTKVSKPRPPASSERHHQMYVFLTYSLVWINKAMEQASPGPELERLRHLADTTVIEMDLIKPLHQELRKKPQVQQ